MSLAAKEIFDRLVAKFGDAVSGYTEGGGTKDPFCKVEPGRIEEVARFSRDEPALRFDFLQCLTGVDTKATLTTVYHLFSYVHRHAFVLKVEVPREAPTVPTVTTVWSTADWLERESYDLVGIVYAGHPDLRRILMPDDWEGHPLRKDFKEKESYRGMPTTRYSPLELLPVYDAHAVEQLRQGGGLVMPRVPEKK